LIKRRPDLGETEAPCRAVEQPRVKPALELLDLLGDQGLRHLHLPRRRGKTAGPDHLCESRHARHSIHARLQRFITLREQSYAEYRSNGSALPSPPPPP